MSLKHNGSIKIGDLGYVFRGNRPKNKYFKSSGKYIFLTGKNIKNGTFISDKSDKYLDLKDDEKHILQPGDIVVSSLWNNRKIYHYKKKDPPLVCSNNLFIIRSNQYEYLSRYFQIEEFYNKFLFDCENILSGVTIPFIPLKEFKNIEIIKITDSELSDKYNSQNISNKNKLNKKSLIESIRKKSFEEIQRNFLIKLVNNYYENDIVKLSKGHESSHLEFKSSFRTDIENNGKIPEKEMINNVIKGIGGFCNTGGGDLLIGVSDENRIIGIEVDKYKSIDHFLRSLHTQISNNTKPDVLKIPDCISITHYTQNNKTICRINVNPCREDVFVIHKGNETYYVRNGPETTPLKGSKLLEYSVRKKQSWN